MKKLIYLVPVLIAFATSCAPTSTVAPAITPQGTFAGEFRLLHKKPNQIKFDTLKANIQVVLSGGKNYEVLGDTATVHAGSKGIFEMGTGANAGFIGFTDVTYPTNKVPTKTHLIGAYQYYYDGSKFQMVANSLDTLSLQYDLKKVN